MPIKPNKAPPAKALFVIMLVARSTMGVATADLPPENALRILQASDALYVNLAPPASKQKRYLRSAADMAIGEAGRLNPDISKSKEIESLLGKVKVDPLATLRQSSLTISSDTMTKFQKQYWPDFDTKTPEEAFKSLSLGKMGENPFKSPMFPVWEYLVKKTTSETDVTKAMFEAMDNALGDKTSLAKFLGQAKTSTKFKGTVESLYKYQIDLWVRDDYTPQTVYDLLELNTVEDLNNLPNSPAFSMWAAFNTEKNSVYEAFKVLKGPGPERRVLDPDLMRALATIDETRDNFNFAQGLLYAQLQYLKRHPREIESSFRLFKLKALDPTNPKSTPTDVTMDPLGRLWVDYVYMRKQDENGLTDFYKVYILLKNRIGHIAAIKTMKKVNTDGFFLKHLNKKRSEEKENFGLFLKEFEPEKPMETSG
ncbi:hypothetical protein DD238_004622 [Peronospora effusa]|uniref:RxLR effector protein n=1 Tax=Peronospora effusa TaxID=542832 RepID=A0A3M6VTN4_9STRA|nr:hypothetical protein DD238_004622 [Peronospora effusa]